MVPVAILTGETVDFLSYPGMALQPLTDGQLYSRDDTGLQTIYEVVGNSGPQVIHFSDGDVTVYLPSIRPYGSQEIPVAELPVVTDSSDEEPKPVPLVQRTAFLYTGPQVPHTVDIPSPASGATLPAQVAVPEPGSSASLPAAVAIPSPGLVTHALPGVVTIR